VRLRFGEFVLDSEARQLFRAGEEVHLQPKTFELLDLLVCSRQKALSKRRMRVPQLARGGLDDERAPRLRLFDSGARLRAFQHN